MRADRDPCLDPADGFLDVLSQPAAPAKLCECPLNEPTARQNLEAFRLADAPDDFQGLTPDLLQPLLCNSNV